MAARTDTHEFVDALLGQVPEELHSMLWTLADKRSHWTPVAQGLDTIAEQAITLGDTSDVYVAVSVAQQAQGPFRRISSDNSAGIMGLWADIDVADPDVHKKWNLPPDEESATKLLERCGVPPSILVHSGHGLQAWWLFDEFWEFENEQDRLEAANLAQAWNTTLRVRAAENDWTVDSTFDLARVMRVPGTFNHKGTPVLPVRLLEVNGRRYGRSDFDPFCVDDGLLRELGLSPERSYVVGSLDLRPDAEPPFAKFQALMEIEPSFKQSWERKRRDLADQTASTYDMSLASLAVVAGWSDQEVANLIVASRKKHGDDLKLRQDYYGRTIARAHETHARAEAIEEIEEVTEALRDARRSGDDEKVKEARRGAHESISQQLGIEVIRIIKFRATPPSYRMVTPTVGVDLGGSADVLSWATMRAQIAGATDKLIPRFKTQAWDRLAQMIFDVCEEQDTGIESTEHGQVQLWLDEYLTARPPVSTVDEAVMTEYPYVEHGQVHIFGAQFRRWLWIGRGERVNQKDLGRMLRVFGCEPVKLTVNVDGGQKTTRSVWKVPGQQPTGVSDDE